ncbi:MAG: GNAT family N-acetyltransferase [Bacillota bacterium]
MKTKGSDSDDGDDHSDSYNNTKSILELTNYKKEISIGITDENGKVGYIKGVLLNLDNILKDLKMDGILKVLEFADKEEEEEIKSFYIQVLSKENCKDNVFYITELFIEKEYRGKGIGRKIFEQLPMFLRYNISEPVSCIYLMPGPLEKVDGQVKYIMNSNDEQMILLKQKLIKFYESVGFKRIGDTEFYYKVS